MDSWGNLDWWGSVAGGVISGFVASALFLTCTRLLRPKIHISKNISVYPSDDNDEEIVRIKIVNRRFRDVADLTIQLYVEHKRQVDGGEVKVRKAIGSKVVSHVQPGRKLRDREFDNARRVRIDKKELIDALVAKPNGYLVAEAFARDAVSGVGTIFERKYALSTDRFIHGSFKFGNSDIILPYSGALPFKLPGEWEDAKKKGKFATNSANLQANLEAL